MSGQDSWPPPPPLPPPPPEQQAQPNQQPSQVPPGAQGGPIPQQQAHRPLPPYASGPGQQPGGPVLPPPSSMGSGGPFYPQPSHPLPGIPGLSAATHSAYSIPGLSSTSTHGPPSSAPPVGSSPGQPPAQQQVQQAAPSQPVAPQGPPQPPHPSMSNTSPSQHPAGLQHTPPLATQAPQMSSLSTAQGPPQPGPQPTAVQHALSAIPGPQPTSQQQNGPPHQPGVNPNGPGPSPSQQAAAAQMPPSASGAGNGPGGPILNDALSYLDQVKYQFQDQPDVYNKFLDIMKDFKSQAIDTPGVIERVSTLFSGHPSLIQGFNTFLPPGYRIECSQDPRDAKITVTTPSGVVHAASGESVSIGSGGGMPLTQAALNNASGPDAQARSRFFDQQGSRWGIDGMYGPYGPNGNSSGHNGPSSQQQQASQQDLALDIHHQRMVQAQQQQAQAQAAQAHQQAQQQAQQQQVTMQQQQQQGVNQLQNAAAHTNGAAAKGPSGLTAAGPGTPGVDARGAGKGPVEFNHAISYVNKIKNRFAQQPEIYKNFLEILQTYQRESKPIQDVYSQVTQLFHSAPDLLEDFKQFLPESAAQARAAAAAKAAADEAAGNSSGVGPSGPPPSAGAAAGATSRLPAVGTFPPPPTVGKEKKKRGVQTPATPLDAKPDAGAGRGANKRHKVNHQKPSTELQIANVSPTLTPFMPEPLGPPQQPTATIEELAFFDRVKKFIGNKQTYNEFLKLLNLFSQSLIGKDMLVEKVHNFIGGNGELMNWFKRFVGWEGREEHVDNTPKSLNKVRLSVCRGLGPSYRLLPKLEAQKPCSGRDEMCWEVLNDEWASHPTWASEDSGFVAHKKNQYEDILHRIEEERHDYDFNIEANLRTIQLLEPIAQRIASMSPEEKREFKLMPGLGGQSKTIYQRVIKKVYDRERGLEVIDHLHNRPVETVPVVLKRLKQKDEEWKAAQREWQKVWRDQTARVFWKSLDHQGIAIKQNDKKTFAARSLINEIQAKHKEQANRRLSPTTPAQEYQFSYSFADFNIILDASRLLAVSLEHKENFSINDREKIDGFIKSFIPLFFGMNSRDVEDTVNSVARKTPDEDGDESVGEVQSPRARQRGAKHDQDLLKDVLKRGKPNKNQRKDKEGSIASGSKESTPEIHDNDVDMDSGSDRPIKEEGTWIAKPLKHLSGLKPGMPMSPIENETQQVTKRTVYPFYCNATIYCFFRLFQILCSRLADVKGCEDEIRQDVDIRKQHKVAHELNIASSRVQDLFSDTSDSANYYSQVLDMCEKFIEGEVDSPTFEEGLRSVYVGQGWKLYTIDRLLVTILKNIQSIVPSDTKEKNIEKEKNGDVILRFQKDRERKEFTRERGEYQELIAYRRNVESMLGSDEAVYRIDWHEDTKDATIRFVPRDEATVNNDLDKDERWNYYIQTYMMCSPTEGIPLERCKRVFLRRSYPDENDLPEGASPRELAGTEGADGAAVEENMEVRICVNTYRLFFMPHTEDFIVQCRRQRIGKGAEHHVKVAEKRLKRWKDVVLPKLGWLKDASNETIEEKTKEWEKMLKDGPPAGDDVAMGGV